MTQQLQPPSNEIIDDKEQFKAVENEEEKNEKPITKLSREDMDKIRSIKRLTYGMSLSQSDIKFIERVRKLKHRLYTPYSYCEKCGFITAELFEMPLSSNNPLEHRPSIWHCSDCKDKQYYKTGKGTVIDEVKRRETMRIKYKTNVVEVPQA